MKLTDYNYILPKAKIAQHPPRVRGNAKLLVLDRASGKIQDKKYKDVVDYLEAGDVLVLNDTKVIKARLMALGSEGKWHELLLLEKHGDEDIHHHKVLYKGKLVAGQDLSIDKLNIRVEGIYGDGTALISSSTDLSQLAQAVGTVPLPPYMKREATPEDTKRYQTQFAKFSGSVAAPTASLNMTKKLLQHLQIKGIKVHYLTLHVGLGTFLPIREDDISKHNMHSEWFNIPKNTVEAIQKAKANHKKVVALGTTVARTLEYSAAHIDSSSDDLSGEADIFIYPGYEFKIVDSLITNFHAPKSTVLMLTAAFAGWPLLKNAYEHALHGSYRFLSYGDSMLIIDN